MYSFRMKIKSNNATMFKTWAIYANDCGLTSVLEVPRKQSCVARKPIIKNIEHLKQMRNSKYHS